MRCLSVSAVFQGYPAHGRRSGYAEVSQKMQNLLQESQNSHLSRLGSCLHGLGQNCPPTHTHWRLTSAAACCATSPWLPPPAAHSSPCPGKSVGDEEVSEGHPSAILLVQISLSGALTTVATIPKALKSTEKLKAHPKASTHPHCNVPQGPTLS